MGLARAPEGGRGSAGGQRRRPGQALRVYDELLRERGVTSAQVLLTFFDMSARTHYLNARQTLRRLLDWRVVPVINENDTTTTDEISFGDNDFLAAQVAILIGATRLVLLTDTDGLYTGRPALDPAARARRRGHRLRGSRRCRSATRRRRWARAGCARRSSRRRWRRRRGSATICNGLRAGALARRARTASREGTRFPAAAQPLLVVQALAALRQADARARCVVDAGAARALREGGTSLLPVGDRRGRGARSTPATRSRSRRDGRADRQGDLDYTADELRRVKGLESAGRAICRARPRKPCTATARADDRRSVATPTLVRASWLIRAAPLQPRRLAHESSRRGTRPQSSPRSASPRARRASLAGAGHRRRRTRAAAIADALSRPHGRDPRGQRARHRGRPRGRRSPALLDRLPARRRPGRRDRRRRPRDRRAARPGRRGVDGGRLPNGLDAAQGPRPVRRRRRRLRGAAERHDRRRGAVPEVGQRGRAARLARARALQRGRWRPSPPTPMRRRHAGGRVGARRRRRARGAAPSWRRRTASST